MYLITSDGDVDPATLAAWIRSHREIENCLHWVRGVTYLEDKSQARTGNAHRVMASPQSLAMSPIAPIASWPKMIPHTARSAKALPGDRTEHVEG